MLWSRIKMVVHPRTKFFRWTLTPCPSVWRWVVVALLVASFGWGGRASAADTRGMVSSGHPLATAAGLDVLKSGGNAIDAAVAVGLTLGVVDVCNSGIGGGCLMLIHLANGKLVAIDGRETAPAAATRDMFIRDGQAVPALSQTGALASGVPGELAAFEYAAKRFGKKQWRELVQPAADLAEPLTRYANPAMKALLPLVEALVRGMVKMEPVTGPLSERMVDFVRRADPGVFA